MTQRRRVATAGVVMLLCMATFTTEATAQSPIERSFSVDSRYFVQSNSNVAVGRFGIDVVNLTTLTADWIGPGGRGRQMSRGLAVLLTSFYLGEGFSLAYHEYGHGTRNAAVGFGSQYGFGTLRSSEDAENARRDGELSDNIFGYYLRTLVAGTGGFTLRTTENTSFTPFSEERRRELGWDGLRRASGMNNEMFYTELIEDEVYRRGGHIGFFSAYVKGKLAASQFSSSASEFGDINRVLSFYEDSGLAIDQDDVHGLSRAAFFLSSLSYQITYQALGVFLGKSFRFEPWTFRAIQPPNTSFYMNREGLSLKVRSSVRSGNWRFPVAIERVVKGHKRSEFTFGAQRHSARVGLGVSAIMGEKLGVDLEARYRLNTRLEISGGYSLLNARNLSGARLIPSLEGGFSYHSLQFRTSIVY